MPTESLRQTENIRIFPLSVPQGLNLLVQFRVDSPAGLTQLLVQTLSGTLVRRDGPLLDVVQLVVLHQALPWGRGCRQGNTTGGCKDFQCFDVSTLSFYLTGAESQCVRSLKIVRSGVGPAPPVTCR